MPKVKEVEPLETEVAKAPPEDVELKTKVDLKDLRTGWLFENDKNQVLVVKHGREHSIVRTINMPAGPGLPNQPFRQVTPVPRSERVIYNVGEFLDVPDRKNVKASKNVSFEEFCKMVKDKGYQFKKVI